MILAADVGGTKTNIGFFDFDLGELKSVVEETYDSRQYHCLEDILRNFLGRNKQMFAVTSACFGVAGPVSAGRCELVNLGWTVEADQIAEEFGIPKVRLVNDLEATAYSINVLSPHDFVELNRGMGARATGNRAVIAAGTGLGEAGLFWDGYAYHPFASEGGHSTFAPRDEIELELAAYLRERFGHASWERVLSGPGLVNLYDFFARRNHADVNQDVRRRVDQDGAVAISDAAVHHECKVCEQTLDLFVGLYGAESGNLALKMLATGGVYIGGGIAARIVGKLKERAFLDAFLAKGRMKSVQQTIPLCVIKTNRAALIGAAECARLNNLITKGQGVGGNYFRRGKTTSTLE